MARIPGLVAALVLTIATSPALAQSEPEASDTTVNEDVLVERVLWPVFLDPGRCGDVRPDEIVVTEDDVECKVTALDESPPARVHALLIDNSGSMEPVLGRLKRAAIEYVRNTPPDEPVIVTSFANNVILEAGLSDDRAQQIAAIEGLRIGHRTALLDAMYYMMRYIEHRPEPKVMIVFTDTIDNASFGRHDGGQLLSLARSVPDLSVFVVHFKVPIRQAPDASELLDRLTVETGGTYSRAKGGSLRNAFRAIRERLDNQAFISYTPPAFGQGPLDGTPERDHHFRQVEVTARRGSRCRITSAGPPTRLAGWTPPVVGPMVTTDHQGHATPARALVEWLCAPPLGWRVEETLEFPFPPTWPTEDGDAASLFHLSRPPTMLFGRTLDILSEKGVRYDPHHYREHGRYRLLLRAPGALSQRDFAAAMPALDVLQSGIHTAADSLDYLLSVAGCERLDAELTSLRHPMFVHGQTWLELRRYLAEAMYRSRADYREWAGQQLERKREAKVDAMLATYAQLSPLPDAERERLRALLVEQVPRGGPERAHLFLGEWLGDVPAHDLSLELERKQVNRMLAHGRTDSDALDDLRLTWARLQSWFSPPAEVRIVTPLVPAYDPERNVIGFYRVVLPRLNPLGPPVDLVPAYPFAAETIDMFQHDGRLAADFAAGWTLTDLRSTPLDTVAVPAPDNRLFVSMPGHAPHAARRTEMTFDDGNGDSFVLTAVHVRTTARESRFALLCVEAPAGPERSLAAKLRQAIDRDGMTCQPEALRQYRPAI